MASVGPQRGGLAAKEPDWGTHVRATFLRGRVREQRLDPLLKQTMSSDLQLKYVLYLVNGWLKW